MLALTSPPVRHDATSADCPGSKSVNHRAARLSLAAALLISTLLGLIIVPARASASDLTPSQLLVTVADLPPGFAPMDEPGVASLLPDNLARQAAASFKRDSDGPGMAYARQVVLVFDGRDASEYVSRFQGLMVKRQGYSAISSDDSEFRLARQTGEESSAVAARALGEVLVVTTVSGMAGTIGPDDAAGLTRIAVARAPAVDQAAVATTGGPEGTRLTLANARTGRGHLDIPNQQDAAHWPQALETLPKPPSIDVIQARSDRPVGDQSLDALMPIEGPQNRGVHLSKQASDLSHFTIGLAPLLDEFWSRALSMTDVDYESPGMVVVREEDLKHYGCPISPTRAIAIDSMAYCLTDGVIYVYEPFLKSDLVAGSDWRSRDFVIAAFVAHEWGHHIQTLTGFSLVNLVLQINQEDKWPLFSRQRELQADCYAGLFSRYARDRSWLNPGDLTEALDGMVRVGDDDFEGLDHHGTAAERKEWFMRGYVHYKFRDCEPW